MKRSRFTEVQVIGILREQEAGSKTITPYMLTTDLQTVFAPREPSGQGARRLHGLPNR